jgi:nucleoside-diphosphate-sugar epimerase
MRAVVTGGAGFIGSTLTERLLDEGYEVTVLDSFTEYYEPARKRANLAAALERPGVTVVEADLATAELDPLLDGADVVWHLAGQPGVRLSWDGFATYVDCNVLASQRLLEAAKRVGSPRFVYASSSSVYGNAERYPTLETDRPEPFSPYGVTKLAAEHLCVLYAANWGVPTVSLRYFTVYGPRQRPDMATHRLVECALEQQPFRLYGDGEQERAFTYVGDVVDATYRAGITPDVPPGSVLNVSGSFSCKLKELIDLVGRTVGAEVPLDRRPAVAGDALRTGGSTERIESLLGWKAATSLEEGVAAQVDWHRSLRSTEGAA